MTREELLASLEECVAGLGPTSSKRVREALGETIEFLKTPFAESVGYDGFDVLRESCASELEAAAALRIGVMDSDSKRAQIENQRLDAMQSVAARLRG